MHGEHARAQRASSRDGRRYGVGNIVKFQVQEDFVAADNHLAHQRGAFGGEKLLAYFESGDRIPEGGNDVARLRRGGDIEGNNQAVADGQHPDSV